MADSSPARLARWSKAPAQVHRIAAPVQDRAGFRRDVAALVARIRPAILVPTCEEVFHLAAARDDGEDLGPLFAPSIATLDRLQAKDRFNSEARALGLDVPATTVVTRPVDPEGFELDRVVLKPCYSRFGQDTLVHPTPEAVAALRPTPERPWVVQDRIVGAEHSAYAVVIAGQVVAFTAYLSTMKLNGGAGYAFVPAGQAVADRLLAAVAAIAAGLDVTGQVALDAIDDGERSWLIECNPRATSGVHLLAGDGRLANAMTAGGRLGEPRQNLPMMLSHGLPHSLNVEGSWRRMIRARDIIGAPGDRLPLLGALADTLAFAFEARRHGATLAGATTRDIEWNGAGR